jgi:hypothetical protein
MRRLRLIQAKKRLTSSTAIPRALARGMAVSLSGAVGLGSRPDRPAFERSRPRWRWRLRLSRQHKRFPRTPSGRRGTGLGHFQNRGCAVTVLNRGRLVLRFQATAICSHQGVTFAALNLLGGIIVVWPAGFGGFDTLRVDDCRAGAGLASDALAVKHNQVMIRTLPGSVVSRTHESAVCRLVWREVLGQHALRDTAAQDEEDRGDQFAHLPGPASAGLGGRRQERGEYPPLCVGQITRIA